MKQYSKRFHRAGLYNKLWGERLGYLGEKPTPEQKKLRENYKFDLESKKKEGVIRDLFGDDAN